MDARARLCSGPRLRTLPALVLVAAMVLACRGRRQAPPSMVVVVVDTLRRDSLGCYGAERPTSPSIDALAAAGARFDRAYAPAPWTLPSITSILTGLYPSGHGVKGRPRRLDDRFTTMAEVLKGRGYATGAVVSNLLLGTQSNLQQGFDDYVNAMEGRHHQDPSTGPVTDAAVALIERYAGGGGPFLLFVHYFDPHYDYQRHPEYGFAPAGAGRLDGSQTFHDLERLDPPLRSDEVDFVRRLYEEEVRATDDGIGRLVEALRGSGMLADTAIVVTGDHGEEFLDHGGLGHGSTLRDELVRVPLVVRLPGGAAPCGVEAPVSVVSIMATLLDLAGAEAPDPLPVGSLLPLVRGSSPETPAPPVFCEVAFERERAYQRAVVTAEGKVVRDDLTGTVEIYGPDGDQRADAPMLAENTLAARLLKVSFEVETKRHEGVVIAVSDQDLDAEDEAALRDLGYLAP